MPEIRTKSVFHQVKSFDDNYLTIKHWISTEGIDDGGDSLAADGMIVRGKVVVMVLHGKDPLFGGEPWAKNLGFEVGYNSKGEKGIIATTQYYDGSGLTPPDNTGQRLYEKAKQDIMPNWSVGWLPASDPKILPGGAKRYDKWILLEYSQVHVGMNRNATTDNNLKQGELMLKFLFQNEEGTSIKGGDGSGNHGEQGEDGEKKWNGKFHQSIKHAIKMPDADGKISAGIGTHEKTGNRLIKCGYSGKSGDYSFNLHDNEQDDCYDVHDKDGKTLASTSKLKALPALASKCLAKALNVKCDDKGYEGFNLKSIAENIVGDIPRSAMDTIYYSGFLGELSNAIWNNDEGFDAEAFITNTLDELSELLQPYALQYVNDWRAEIVRRNGGTNAKSIDDLKIELKTLILEGKQPGGEKAVADPAATATDPQNTQAPAQQPVGKTVKFMREKVATAPAPTGKVFTFRKETPAAQTAQKTFTMNTELLKRLVSGSVAEALHGAVETAKGKVLV